MRMSSINPLLDLNKTAKETLLAVIDNALCSLEITRDSAAAWPDDDEEREIVREANAKIKEYQTIRQLFDDETYSIVIRFTISNGRLIQVVKNIRQAFGIGLAESKRMCDEGTFKTNRVPDAVKFINSCKHEIQFYIENGPDSLRVLYGDK